MTTTARTTEGRRVGRELMLVRTVRIRRNKSLTLEEQYDSFDYYPSHCPGHFFPSQAYSGIDILIFCYTTTLTLSLTESNHER